MKDRLIELLEKADETIMGFTIDGDLERLADHLLANGVIVPKCKRGQKFYDVWGFVKGEVEAIILDDITDTQTEETLYYAYDMDYHGYESFTDEDIGKTVFLTKAEAEKALAERREI